MTDHTNTPSSLRPTIVWMLLLIGLLLPGAAVAAQQPGIKLEYGQPVTGTFSPAQPISVFGFDGHANDRITIKAVADARSQPRLVLLDSRFNPLALSSDRGVGLENADEALISYQLSQTTSYYVTIASANGIPGSFTLTLESENAATRDTMSSQSLSPPSVVTAESSPLLPPIELNINVSSNNTTVFSEILPALASHRLRLHFVDLIEAQPQIFRLTLTCVGNHEFLLNDIRCDDTFTVTPDLTGSGAIPIYGLDLAIPTGAFVDSIPYTLTVTPESPFVPVAYADSNHIVDAPLNTVTVFDQSISAPLGDTSDRITVRAPAFLAGSWDFSFSLLCAGVGVERVQWSLPTGPVLACGDVHTLPLAPAPGTNPVPSVDMFVSLASGAAPTYVDYTLLITPAGLAPSAGSGAHSFSVPLTGKSQFLQNLSAAATSHVVSVSVPALAPGYPRAIAFTLACASSTATDVQAAMPGVLGVLTCGDHFQRSFTNPNEQVQFTIQLGGTGLLTYLLRAEPVYGAVAPPDVDPYVLQLHPRNVVTRVEMISGPEGDREDYIILDASQVGADQQPRVFTITLGCEGPNRAAVRGEVENGSTFSCGSTFEHTFSVTDGDGRGSGQTGLQALPTLSSGGKPTPIQADVPATLQLRIHLPADAPAGLTHYVLQAAPIAPASEASTLNEYVINASSTAVSTFSQTLTVSRKDRLRVLFPDLVGAHRQAFYLRLICSGVGTAAVQWFSDTGQLLGCGDSFYGEFEEYQTGMPPGIDMILEFGQTDVPVAVSYTLVVEPASLYVPIAPADESSGPYQLALSTTAKTLFTQEISAPLGDQVDQIRAMIPDMIGGQVAGRDFTFWLECEGANAGITRLSIEMIESTALYGLCGVPLVLFIDEAAGSPPNLFLRVAMEETSQPAYTRYTLHVIPAGVELPFVVPVTPTSTPFMLQAVTLAPTVTFTPTPTPNPVLPPELLAPANGAIFDAQPVLLSWTALPNDPRYEVEIQRCNPQSNACTSDVIMTNTNSYSLGLVQTTQVTWRVRAILTDGSVTSYTPTRTFQVFLVGPTATPVASLALLAPANGAIFDAQPVLLSWTALPNDPRYEVEIQRCNPQSNACTSDAIMTNTNSYSLGLAQTTQVTWRVRAILTDGSVTSYTPTRTFQVFLVGPTVTQAASPIPVRMTNTPLPVVSEDVSVAPPDRDHALVIQARGSTRYSDVISFPEGDSSDTILVTVEGLDRAGQIYGLALTCAGTGAEFVRWEVRGLMRDLACGAAVVVNFQPGANRQSILVTLPRGSGRSYISYTLSITPA